MQTEVLHDTHEFLSVWSTHAFVCWGFQFLVICFQFASAKFLIVVAVFMLTNCSEVVIQVSAVCVGQMDS